MQPNNSEKTGRKLQKAGDFAESCPPFSKVVCLLKMPDDFVKRRTAFQIAV
jgi:hypothetical protein